MLLLDFDVRMTVPSCEREWENAPKPSCHENLPYGAALEAVLLDCVAFILKLTPDKTTPRLIGLLNV